MTNDLMPFVLLEAENRGFQVLCPSAHDPDGYEGYPNRWRVRCARLIHSRHAPWSLSACLVFELQVDQAPDSDSWHWDLRQQSVRVSALPSWARHAPGRLDHMVIRHRTADGRVHQLDRWNFGTLFSYAPSVFRAVEERIRYLEERPLEQWTGRICPRCGGPAEGREALPDCLDRECTPPPPAAPAPAPPVTRLPLDAGLRGRQRRLGDFPKLVCPTAWIEECPEDEELQTEEQAPPPLPRGTMKKAVERGVPHSVLWKDKRTRVRRAGLGLDPNDTPVSPHLLATVIDPRSLAEDEQEGALAQVLECMRKVLSPRERLIVTLRFLTPEPPTHKAIGQQIMLTRERVRQIEVEALGRLRLALVKPRPGTVRYVFPTAKESRGTDAPREEAANLMTLLGIDMEEFVVGVRGADVYVLDLLERDLLLPVLPAEGPPEFGVDFRRGLSPLWAVDVRAHIEQGARQGLAVIANERRRRRGESTAPWNGRPYPDPRRQRCADCGGYGPPQMDVPRCLCCNKEVVPN